MPRWNGPWVLVNAWGVFDTRSDPFGSYTRNTEPNGHPMINLVTDAVQQDHLDIVFAAGNCGQFCPSGYCGGLDCGPGHSIWGANAHPLVITAGAVRSDETWVGYSSQGPGPELLAVRKPDLCAPSQFCETFDAALLSSGTSASCAMTAGVVAALRGNPGWNQVAVPPGALKAALIAGARKPHGPAGMGRQAWLGHRRCGFHDRRAFAEAALPSSAIELVQVWRCDQAHSYENLEDRGELGVIRRSRCWRASWRRSEATAPLAGKSTLSRLELSREELSAVTRSATLAAIEKPRFVDLFLGSPQGGAEADHPRSGRQRRSTSWQPGRSLLP